MDMYRGSGRGGAGNFFSSKKEGVDNGQRADVQPQRDTTLTQSQSHSSVGPHPSQPSSDSASSLQPAPLTSQPAAAHKPTGRGGAGNFHFNNQSSLTPPSSATAAELDASEIAERTRAAVDASLAAKAHSRSGGALMGRGGTGNWTGGVLMGTKGDVAEKKRKDGLVVEEMEARIEKDVARALTVPRRAYVVGEKGEDDG